MLKRTGHGEESEICQQKDRPPRDGFIVRRPVVGFRSESADRSVRLEQQDRVDAEGRLIVIVVIQSGDLSIIPVEADFGTNDDVGVRLVIHTHRQGVDVVVLTDGAEDAFLVVPLESGTRCDAVAEGVDQVLVDAERFADGRSNSIFRIQQIALEDVLKIVGQGDIGDDRVHVALFDTVEAVFTETTDGRCVGQGEIVAECNRQSAQEVIAIVVKSAVPTEGVTTVGRDGIADVVRTEHTGVGEGLAVVHRVCVAVEEVIGSGNDFPSDDGVEVTGLDREISVSGFEIHLGKGMTVIRSVVPVVVPAARIGSERLGVLRVGTVQVIDPSTEIESVGCVDRLFGVQPRLVQLVFVGSAVEQGITSAVVTHLNPAPGAPAAVLAEQRVGVAQAAIAQHIAETASCRVASTVAAHITCVAARITSGTYGLTSANRLATIASGRTVRNQVNCVISASGHAARVGRAGNRSQHGNLAKLHRF